MHYKDDFARSDVFDHYRVLDIWEPCFYNVARRYERRGRAQQPTWLLAPRISAM